MDSVAVVVFTRDLRVRDNPALATACRDAEAVVPLFVVDPDVLATSHGCPNRVTFLLESLADLRASLHARGGDLVVREGRWADEVMRVVHAVSASAIHVADDVSGFAQRRLEGLERAATGGRVDVRRHPGVTVVPPGAVTPEGKDHYGVFTPYWRQWLAASWRTPVRAPAKVQLPKGLEHGGVPDVATRGAPSSVLVAGGETAGLARMRDWAGTGLAAYEARHDDLGADGTSRISAYLHFGCLSPLEVATHTRGREGAGPFVRQVCWRDFYHQVLAARPAAAAADYRTTSVPWQDDDDAFGAWAEGRTGYPLVDAGMRQLVREGWMHNRARLTTASFLTKDLGIDWRRGAAHFMHWLVDGDVASNQLNWQWTAGTGTDTNPHRVLNPTRQAERFDRTGTYIRRYVPELAGVPAPEVLAPDAETRKEHGYPEPIVDHKHAIAAYRALRRA